jgi:hypothetical protein
MDTLRKVLVTVIGLGFLAGAALAAAHVGGSDSHRGHAPRAAHPNRAFAWLRPAVVPAGWSSTRLPGSPARLAAPPGWQPARSDPGTATMVTRAASGRIVGYLNATPRQGSETIANWPSFRPDHNRDEGDRDVRLLASASDMRFRAGTASCVIDSYATSTGHRYREIACLVSGRTASTVIVAAAPPADWTRLAPVLEHAVDSFTT